MEEKAKSEYYTPDWKRMHLELGCYECKFADGATLGKDACCQHIDGPLPDEDGKCKRRRVKEKRK